MVAAAKKKMEPLDEIAVVLTAHDISDPNVGIFTAEQNAMNLTNVIRRSRRRDSAKENRASASKPGKLTGLKNLCQLLLPSLNIITLHYVYFIVTVLISSVIFWGSSTPAKSITYLDSLFLCMSAMTEAGLNTVNLSQLNSWQQVILFVLIIIGSSIFVSAFSVFIRLKVFEREFQDIVKACKEDQRQLWIRRAESDSELANSVKADTKDLEAALKLPENTLFKEVHLVNMFKHKTQDEFPARIRSRVPSEAFPDLKTSACSSTKSLSSGTATPDSSTDKAESKKWYNSSRLRRSSRSHSLTFTERQILGGKEYACICFLAVVVPLYLIVWQLLGSLAVGAWIANHRAATTLANGIQPWWVGIFNAVSAFNNSGMSLLDANMTVFQDAVFVLVTMGLLILAGNTAYPIFLRASIWLTWRLLPSSDAWRTNKDNLRFLLDHPRRCYTRLFPAQHTWWLGLMLIVLNGIDWAMFEILNIGNPYVEQIPHGDRVLDGLFQALAVRSGGFYVVAISNLRIAVQVLYVIMMYISAFPVTITMRNTNLYEDLSFGIYAQDPRRHSITKSSDEEETSPGWLARATAWLDPATRPRVNFVHHQVRAQLTHDAWFLALAVFLIMIVEASAFERDPATFSVFNVIFEVVSGYGCVGISVGAPGVDFSFSGVWRPLSKFILIIVMLRGRHRGLPVALDHAVQLPSARHWVVEEEETGQVRFARATA